jgi:hypothetical protein
MFGSDSVGILVPFGRGGLSNPFIPQSKFFVKIVFISLA